MEQNGAFSCKAILQATFSTGIENSVVRITKCGLWVFVYFFFQEDKFGDVKKDWNFHIAICTRINQMTQINSKWRVDGTKLLNLRATETGKHWPHWQKISDRTEDARIYMQSGIDVLVNLNNGLGIFLRTLWHHVNHSRTASQKILQIWDAFLPPTKSLRMLLQSVNNLKSRNCLY